MSLAPERVSIGLRRLFTSPGVDPYDEVVWERRDARITNWKDGTVAFEQRDVEFPVAWSVNATNIVAQKYFRGTLGTPERETSLRQVVDRVVDTITRWGIEGGYFVDDSEAEAFSAELKYILVTQTGGLQQPGVVQHRRQGRARSRRARASRTTRWSARPRGWSRSASWSRRDAVGTKVFDANGLTQRRRRQGQRTQAGAPNPHQGRATPSTSRPTTSCGGRAARARAGSFAAGDLQAGDQSTGTAPSLGRGRDRPDRDRRGRARRLAAGRRVRRPVRPRHQPFAHDRGA